MAQDPFDAAWDAQDVDPFDAAWGESTTATAIAPIGGAALLQDFKTHGAGLPGPRQSMSAPATGQAVRSTQASPEGPTGLGEAVRSVGRGAAVGGMTLAQGALMGQEAFDRATERMWEALLGYDVGGVHGAREAAQKLETAKGEVLPPRGERTFWRHDLWEMGGSTVPLAASGLAGGPIAVALTGAMTGFGAGFYDAEAQGATEEEKWTSGVANALIGTAEGVPFVPWLSRVVGPVGRALARINQRSGGALRQALTTTIVEGGMEGLQEGGSQVASNVAAKLIYDEDREAFAGLRDAGAGGAIIGVLLSAASQGVLRLRAETMAAQAQSPEKFQPGPLAQAAEPKAATGFVPPMQSEAGPVQPATAQEGAVATPPGGAGVDPAAAPSSPLQAVPQDNLTQPVPEPAPEQRSPDQPATPLERPVEAVGVAVLPADEGLFGPVEREQAPPEAAVGEAAAPTPSMFDEQPGDVPGQRSILDLSPEELAEMAAPKAKPQTGSRSDAARERQARMASGETTLRDFIAKHGGLAYTPELWARFSRKETGERGPVGTGLVVHPKGSGKGMSLHDAITLAGESGLLFNAEGSYGTGHDEFLDALESDVTPLNAERVQADLDKAESDWWGEEPPPATPEAAAAEAERTTSIKNAKVDEELAAMGMEPALHGERTTFEDANERAAQTLKDNPFAGQELLNELRRKQRALNGDEVALLTRERNRLRLIRDRVEKEIIAAGEAGDTDLLESLEEQAGKIAEEFASVSDVVTIAGTKTAQGLALRRMEMKEDYSIAAMEQTIRAAQRGAPLSQEQRDEIRDLHKQIMEAEERYTKSQAANDERIKLLEEQIDTLIKARSTEMRQRKPRGKQSAVLTYLDEQADAARARIKARGTQLYSGIPIDLLRDMAIIGARHLAHGVAWGAEMVKEFGESIKPHLDAIRAESEKIASKADTEVVKAKLSKDKPLRESAMQIRQLAEAFVESGVTEREALIDEVHAVLREFEPGITRRDAMDLISGYGDFKPLSKDEVKVRLRELRGEMQQLAKLEDMTQKGVLPLKSGVEQAQLSEEGRRLQQQVNDTKRRLGLKPIPDAEAHLKSALESIETRLRHQISDIQHEINTKTQRVKGKAAPQSSPEIERLRAERDALLAEHEAIFNPPVQEPGRAEVMRARVQEKALRRAIDDLSKQIQAGEKAVKDGRPGITTPEMERLRAQRDAAQKQLDAITAEQQPGHKQVLSARAAERALVKAIKDYEARIAAGDTKGRKGEPGIVTPERAALQARRDALAAELANLRSAQRPKMSPDERALKAYKARLKSEQARLQERMSLGGFPPKPKRGPLVLDSEAIRAKAALEQAKAKFRKGEEEARWASASAGRKAIAVGKELVFDLPRALKTGFDLGALLSQGAFFAAGHPVMAARQAVVSARMFASEDFYQRVDAALRMRPKFEKGEIGGLQLTMMDAPPTKQEEAIHSRLAEKIPLLRTALRASNRAFSGLLNVQRAEMFDRMVSAIPNPTPEQIRSIARGVNIATGRGDAGKGKGAAIIAGLAPILWAPKLYLSRLQLLAADPIWRGAKGTKKLWAIQYARSLMGLAAFYSLVKLYDAWDDEVETTIETDGRSSDLGKVKIGNTRLDPLAGFGQFVVLAKRLQSGETKSTTTGKVYSIRHGETEDGKDAVPYRGDDVWSVLGKFARSKLNPTLGLAGDLMAGEDYIGEPVSLSDPLDVAKRALAPMLIEDIVQVMEENGVARGSALAMLATFGMRLNVHNPPKEKKPTKPPKSTPLSVLTGAGR